ncbi:MAG: GPR endopeptidase [Ruminococcaceae bacterium]|nr:GPR endopeptidase [Oscillospiraceae bacterium]
MEENRGFIRTDLAQECREASGMSEIKGVKYIEKEEKGFRILYMEIENEEASRIIGKDMGRYVTVETGKIWLLDEARRDGLRDILVKYIDKLCGQANSILVVGLGNRSITSDALGPKAVDKLLVTRHLRSLAPELFESISHREISALCPGVVGQTGIETFELIRGATESVKPDLVIAIDALAARSVDRLASTVQISDSGIAPGSGIGNRRRSINKGSLGVPVLALGIPTVVDSATLVYDALERAGIVKIDDSLTKVLENSKSFFVSLKESDTAVEESAHLLSEALNTLFSL